MLKKENIVLYDALVHNFDILSIKKIVKKKNKELKIALQKVLSDFFDFSIQINSLYSEIKKKKYYHGSSIFQLIYFSNLKKKGLIVFPLEILFCIVEKILTGNISNSYELKKKIFFSSFDKNIFNKISNIITATFFKVWKDVIISEVKVLGGMRFNKLGIVDKLFKKKLFSFCFEICVNKISKNIELMIPIVFLEKVKYFLYNKNDFDIKKTYFSDILVENIFLVEVILVAQFNFFYFSFLQLLSIKRNDVIEVKKPRTVIVYIKNFPIFLCKYGISDNKYAVFVKNVFSEDFHSWRREHCMQKEKHLNSLKEKNNKKHKKEKKTDKSFDLNALKEKIPSCVKSNKKMLDLSSILDIPIEVTVQLGERVLSIRELLKISPGSILVLNKYLGESLNILVNNFLIAEGEIVVVKKKYGIRILKIINSAKNFI